MNQLSLGLQLRDAGCALTLEAEREAWLRVALAALKGWASSGREFTIEELRQGMANVGVRPPHTPQVWGALTRLAIKRGMIQFVRYAKARSPATHGHPVAVWKATARGLS